MSNIFDAESTRALVETLKKDTPFFIFSKQKIQETIDEFKTCFPDACLQYAMKANSEPEILDFINQAGIGFEVASIYELELLQKLHVPASRIMYGTSVKPASFIKTFFDYGVDRFVADSFPELDKIAANAPGARVLIRVRVNDAGSVFKFSEKFGIDKEEIVPMLMHAESLGLKPYGVSFHVGSQASNVRAWANALESLQEILKHLQENDIELEVINLGGGFPCNSYASSENDFSLQDIAEHTLMQYKKLPYQPKLFMEPGRGIIAKAGILVANIIAKIERKEHTWLFLDAGVYNGLFETMAYQGSTRYRVTSLRPPHDTGEALFALAGPTGDSPDVVTREALLPRDIEVGDTLIIHDVGAYSLTTCSPFNGFPKPPIYLV